MDTNNRSTTSPPNLASSPTDFKASSPLDLWHLRQQEPQDKLPKLKFATSTSYYDFDIDVVIPFYGTHDPEEYLKWVRKMDTYLKLLQVPFEDQVMCATSNFHDYASTWWLHTPSKSFEMSSPKMKKAMRQEFMPSKYKEHVQHQLKNTIQGSKSFDKYFMKMKKAFRRAGVNNPIWMKFHFMMGLNNNTAKNIFTNTYKSLNDLYIGDLKAVQELKKAKISPTQAHFTTTKIHDYDHEDGMTKMSKYDELQDNALKLYFSAIPLCGIHDAVSNTTIFKDDSMTRTSPLDNNGLELVGAPILFVVAPDPTDLDTLCVSPARDVAARLFLAVLILADIWPHRPQPQCAA
ncbi:gag-pol polyprotein [Hordeum vulgare]|nr:gag-pol polyprotein [Hordeum vulgare]